MRLAVFLLRRATECRSATIAPESRETRGCSSSTTLDVWRQAFQNEQFAFLTHDIIEPPQTIVLMHILKLRGSFLSIGLQRALHYYFWVYIGRSAAKTHAVVDARGVRRDLVRFFHLASRDEMSFLAATPETHLIRAPYGYACCLLC